MPMQFDLFNADKDIEKQERHARDMGVHGVPAFVYNGKLLFSGAQTPDTFALAIKRAVRKGL